MKSHRLLSLAATLTLAAAGVTAPAMASGSQTAAQPLTSAAQVTVHDSLATDAPTRVAPARSLATSPATIHASSEESDSGSVVGLVMIIVMVLLFIPVCIVYALFVHTSRKDAVGPMPNYTGMNGPQYGVPNAPQAPGADPRWHRGHNPPWATAPQPTGQPGYGVQPPYSTTDTLGTAYGAQPGQGPVYGTGQGPVYGTGQGPVYGIGQGPVYGIGQGPVYGTNPVSGPVYGTDPTQGPVHGQGRHDGTGY